MGCTEGDLDCATSEKPAHPVRLSQSFYMADTETTDAQYAKCVEAGACRAAGYPDGWQPWHRRSDLPVVWVSWEDAEQFCRWLDGRLPSQAEWEFAARGGQEGWRYPWGNEIPVSDEGRGRRGLVLRCRHRSGEELFAQCLRSVRHGGKRLGVGSRRVARELRRGAGGRQRMGEPRGHRVACSQGRLQLRPSSEPAGLGRRQELLGEPAREHRFPLPAGNTRVLDPESVSESRQATDGSHQRAPPDGGCPLTPKCRAAARCCRIRTTARSLRLARGPRESSERTPASPRRWRGFPGPSVETHRQGLGTSSGS